jgi:SAM-dependent methyltransferase
MTDTDTYIHSLLVTNPLMEPVVKEAIRALQLPAGSRGLDAGCGIGLQAVLLAKAVGTAGHVTGLDMFPEFLHHAEDIVKSSGLSEHVSFRQGDVRELPFDDNRFDWAWSSNCVGYSPAIEPVPALKELRRVVRPGGRLAILVWSSEKLLPGYPLLEARLNATASGIAPFAKGMPPEAHFLGALGWLRQAGLQAAAAQTFAGDAHAPLSNDLRAALTALIQMRWPEVKSELAREDWSAYQILCQPDSPEFILNRPDYYAFFTCSMFYGVVPG